MNFHQFAGSVLLLVLMTLFAALPRTSHAEPVRVREVIKPLLELECTGDGAKLYLRDGDVTRVMIITGPAAKELCGTEV